MSNLIKGYSDKSAVKYHYGKFPPSQLDYSILAESLADASNALGRYDQMLLNLQNSDLLLAPLRKREAVISSRIEGTISTVDEVLRVEADQTEGEEPDSTGIRSEAYEVFLYDVTLRSMRQAISKNEPITESLIRSAHKKLLSYGRGADKSPGEYKTEQNFIADNKNKKICFIPIAPHSLKPAMQEWVSFAENKNGPSLIKTAISHVEFEALHPFNDGNGRIGRMLITLMLWRAKEINEPHFYISSFFENRKDEYIEHMRNVSLNDNWTDWCQFFLIAIAEQARQNLEKATAIKNLYEEMKPIFREALASQWTTTAQDFIFSNPIFRNSRFTKNSGIPKPTAAKFTPTLIEKGILRELEPAAGRKAALYAFEPLLLLVRE